MAKVNQHGPQLKLNLNSNGTIFAIRKTLLLDRLHFFQEDAARLNHAEHRVSTRVRPAVFSDFVKRIQGEQVEITEANFPGLRDLSQEFGFDDLSAECKSFAESHANTGEVSISSRLARFNHLLRRMTAWREKSLACHLCAQTLIAVFQIICIILRMNSIIVVGANIFTAQTVTARKVKN
jgi:hypothetical protein